MKKGLLYTSALVLGAAAAAIVIVGGGAENEGYYEPRPLSDEATYGAQGYMEWWHSLRANPSTGTINQEEVLAARQQAEQLRSFSKKSTLNLSWEDMGPNNFGGRTRAFIIDNSSPNVLYAGSVSGGLFKSTNSGASWTELTSNQDNIAVNSIAQASDGTVYYGTGENLYQSYQGNGNTSTPAFSGNGVYKLDPSGQITHLSSTDPSLPGNGGWNAVGKLFVDPNNDQRIYAATLQGLRLSDDAGQTWINPLIPNAGGGGANQRSLDLFVTPTGKVWVKVGSDIWFSQTGNNGDYTKMTGLESQFPSLLPASTERMRIAVAPQDENYVYVIKVKSSTTGGPEFDRAFRSTDGGSTWQVIGQQSAFLSPHRNQGTWNNAVTVDPFNKDRVLVGGVDMYEWSVQNGWQQLGRWQTAPPDPFYIHADNHHIVFDETRPGRIYVTNDGGVFRSTDNGVTWTPMVKGYNTIQFYNIGLGANGVVMGGTQDNGTLLVDPAAPIRGSAREVLGGDGGYAQLSKLNPNVIFAESQRGTVRRSADFGMSFLNFINRRRVDPRAVYGTNAWSNWVMPFALWEKLDDPHSTDSIRFGADTLMVNLGFGAGNRTFTGSFSLPSAYTFTRVDPNTGNVVPDSSNFVASSFFIRAGGNLVTSDASGVLQGDGTGNFNPATGRFEVVFNQPVVNDIRAFVQTRYSPGTIIRLESAHNDLPIFDTLFNGLQPNESVLVQDPVQSIFVMALRTRFSNITSNSSQGQLTGANHTGGVWLTREAVSDVDGIPQWHHIGNLQDGEAGTSIAVSDDGDIVWVGTTEGRIYRFSNLINARDSASADIDSLYVSNQFVRPSTSVVQRYVRSFGGGRAVTDISVHPFDKDRVIVTLGNYGRTDYVFYSRNASGSVPSFNSVQGNLPRFPVYAATFNYNDPDDTEVFIGTEFGMFMTEDINAPATAVQWIDASFGMPRVPVLSLRQERTVRYDLKSSNDFEGSIYAGTHGRGIFKTNYSADYVSIKENALAEVKVEKDVQLNVYPNPTTDIVNIDLALTERSDVEISIRDINGRLVKQVTFRKLGTDVPSIEVNVDQLPTGAYLIQMTAGKQGISGKFIKQ